MAQEVYEPKNVLVTGGAGFIGSHVAIRLAKNYPQYKIVVYDKLDYCANLKNLDSIRDLPNVKFVKGDITAADLVSYVFAEEKIDTVMHFAAQTHVDNSFGNSFEFTKNNILGTHVLLEAARLAGTIRRFIHVSTDEVYGETSVGKDTGNEEHHTLEPTNPYSATKAGAEMLVKAYSTSYKLPCITTRGNNVFGPHQYPEKLIPKFILLCNTGKLLPIHGTGGATRSYLFVEDVAEAFDCILHKGVTGEVYNIGTSKEQTVLEVATALCSLFGIDPEKRIQFVQDRPFNDQRYFLDHQKIAELGWAQRTDFKDGLKKTVDWYLKSVVGQRYWENIESALVAHPRQGTNIVIDAVPWKGPDLAKREPKFLIFGKSGWIGGLLGNLLTKMGHKFEYASARIQDRSALIAELERVQPTHVMNAAGLTGRPNVDWCDLHKQEVIRVNFVGVMNLVDVCYERNIHVTNFATGCIFEYDEAHPEYSGIGFTEEDKPNFGGSFYSETKGMVEPLLKDYPNCFSLRVRMPITADLANPRNFITKIASYEKVVNIPNSMTVLDEMLPIAIEGAKRGLAGIYNYTNPGVITHNQCLELYREYIDPSFTWKNFTLEEQAKVILTARSNNELDCTKLKAEFPELLGIKESLIEYVFKPNKAAGFTGITKNPKPILGAASETPPLKIQQTDKPVFLVYGASGWIGGLIVKLLTDAGMDVHEGTARLQTRDAIGAELERTKATHVISAAGITGRPNIDWCETNRPETLRTNVIGTLNLVDLCYEKGVHVTNVATGCIYDFDEAHPMGSGKAFSEEDQPNFERSYYSRTKKAVERLLKEYNNCLTLRVRLPISGDLTQPRNLVTKLTKFQKVVCIPNSMTVLDEMLPVLIELAKRNVVGIYNFTNPGAITHVEILELYKQYVDPTKDWQTFTIEEQNEILKAPRCNCELDASKLLKEFPHVKSIKDSLIEYVFKPNVAN